MRVGHLTHPHSCKPLLLNQLRFRYFLSFVSITTVVSALTDKATASQQQASILQEKSSEATKSLAELKDSVTGILGLFK